MEQRPSYPTILWANFQIVFSVLLTLASFLASFFLVRIFLTVHPVSTHHRAHPGILNQNVWRWGPGICFESYPSNSVIHQVCQLQGCVIRFKFLKLNLKRPSSLLNSIVMSQAISHLMIPPLIIVHKKQLTILDMLLHPSGPLPRLKPPTYLDCQTTYFSSKIQLLCPLP